METRTLPRPPPAGSVLFCYSESWNPRRRGTTALPPTHLPHHQPLWVTDGTQMEGLIAFSAAALAPPLLKTAGGRYSVPSLIHTATYLSTHETHMPYTHTFPHSPHEHPLIHTHQHLDLLMSSHISHSCMHTCMCSRATHNHAHPSMQPMCIHMQIYTHLHSLPTVIHVCPKTF